MQTTTKTITAQPTLRMVSNSPKDRIVMEAVPEPSPFVKITVEVQIGFTKVVVELTEDCLASCHHDKHLNAIRQSEIAVYAAFKEVYNAHNPAPAN